MAYERGRICGLRKIKGGTLVSLVRSSMMDRVYSSTPEKIKVVEGAERAKKRKINLTKTTKIKEIFKNMTVKELESQIISLKDHLGSLKQELDGLEEESQKNSYGKLVYRAERAFLKNQYLEAFLIQSCVIEGIIKEYATKKLLPMVSKSIIFKNKFKKFELARIIDELFISGKIEKSLYEKLNTYRKKRNKIIHDLLGYKDKNKLDKELKEVYESGRYMKGFIVGDMNKEITGGLTAMEVDVQIETLLNQLSQLQSQLIGLEKNNYKD